MNDPQILKNLKPTKEFFIGIDSDGCVFDVMELKHKECFAPMFIKHFRLQTVNKYAREVWDFVNLYSKTRGANRFQALARALNLLRERKEVIARGVAVPSTTELEAWMARSGNLSNAALKKEVEAGHQALAPALAWSQGVNQMVAELDASVPPFPFVRDSLQKMVERADVIVVSQAPSETLAHEWKEHGIDRYVRILAGQELGTKGEHIRLAAGGKYPPERILMIGDAPGDFKAARSNQALFYPIVPGREEASWERLLKEGLDRFHAGTYAGAYEAGLIKEFDASLPEKPCW
ncbi:MAG: HAD family hydrolase [Opitutaceae bacterium]|jgi:phosphoglycolate phosphatase-like HAD superfamily hydrolase